MLGSAKRPDIPPTDDFRRPGQRAGRLGEELLVAFDERAAVMREHQPGVHTGVPDHVSGSADLLVRRVRVGISEIPDGDGGLRPTSVTRSPAARSWSTTGA